MAVLNKIRQRSVFLIIIIALALFSFVLADVIRNGGMVSQKSQNTIASINGEDIDREQFARQVEAYRTNMGPSAASTQAVNAVFDMNVRRVVLQEQFEELGIRVEEAQVKQMLRQQLAGNPTFSNEAGMFDENRLREYVSTLRSTSPVAYQQWVDFENSVAETAKENIYFNLIRAGVTATLLEGEQVYRHANDNVDMKFVQIPYSSIPDSEVEVSKSEIQAYIKKHPKQFETEASRDIRFVHFPETASLEDEAEVKEGLAALLNDRVEYNAVTGNNDTIPGFSKVEEVETFVNENSDVNYTDMFLFQDQLPREHASKLFELEEGEVYGPYKDAGAWKLSKVVEVAQIPDSIKSRHILVSFQGSPVAAGVTRTKAEARELADSIAGVVRADREKFAALASEFSADASNKENAGDLGWAAPGTFVPAFEDFLLRQNEGAIDVVETEFGFHVIHIEEQSDREKAVKLATLVRDIQPSEESLNDLFAEVTKFELAARDGDFEAVAKESGEEVRPVQDIKVLEENIPGLGAQRAIVQWAFEDGVKAGDIRRFEVNDGYVVAQVTAVHKEGLRSAESASATVLPLLRKEKKAEMIKAKLSGNDLASIAQSQGEEVQTANAVNLNSPTLPGAGSEPLVVGTAFGLEPGQVSEPIAGVNGVYVVELIQKNEAPKMDSYRGFAGRETANRRISVPMEVFEALKNSAEIEDNRARFY